MWFASYQTDDVVNLSAFFTVFIEPSKQGQAGKWRIVGTRHGKKYLIMHYLDLSAAEEALDALVKILANEGKKIIYNKADKFAVINSDFIPWIKVRRVKGSEPEVWEAYYVYDSKRYVIATGSTPEETKKGAMAYLS